MRNRKDTIRLYLKTYLKNRPLFLGLIRAKELELFGRKAEFKGRVLDFGCGDGWFAKLLTNSPGRTNLSMIGLEVDECVAEKARRSRAYGQVVVYDGKRIPFADNYFDIIISNCVLEHVRSTGTQEHKNRKTENPKLKRLISEIYRVLKREGKFYTTVMTKEWEEYLFGSLFLGNFYKKWMRRTQKHYNLLSAKNWQTAFESAGFIAESVIGYLDRRASRWIDFLHYVSVGSLLSYKLFEKWVLFPWQYDLIPVDKWAVKLIEKDIKTNKAAALFFTLEKAKSS